MHYALAAAICSLAAFTQGFSGFGSALITVPLLTLVMPIHQAVPVSIMVSFFFGPYLTWTNRKSIDYSTALPMVGAGIFGIPVGIYALKNMSPSLASATLGGAIIALIAVRCLFKVQVIGEPRPWKAAITGIFAGTLAGAFNTSGPPVVAYLHLTSSPQKARATMYFVFLVLGSLNLAGHTLGGEAGMRALKLALVAGPCTLVGASIGGRLAERTSAERFKQVVSCLLVALGVYLIIRAWL